ncbi:hypothetical protein L7F22_014307 [Adiantum nelumboides]|nr:hypothetical protein [Adiantum nelumboides]
MRLEKLYWLLLLIEQCGSMSVISSTEEDEEGEEDKEDQQDGMKTDIQIGQDPEGDQENAGFHHLLNKTLQQQRQEEEEREKDPFLTKIGDVHDEDSDDEAMAESNDDLPQMDGIDAEGGDQNQPQQQQNQIDVDAIDSEDDGEDDDSDDIDSQAKKLGCDKAQRGFLQKVEKDGKLAQYQSKLDGIMKTVFDFLSSQEDLFKELTRNFQSLTAMMQSNSNRETLQNLEKCKINLEKIKSSRIATFNTLMMIYCRIILKTHQSRHVQFLLFWYSSLDDSFADELLGNFVIGAFGESMNDDNNLNSNSNPSLILQDHQRISTNPDFQLQNDMALRRSYCAYLASFCSRAKHCSSDYLQHVTQLLVEELDSHLRKHYELKDSNIGQGKNEGDRIHESWYAIAQAVMYIFCFRWKDLRKDAGKDRDLDQATGYVKITDDEDDPMKGLPPLDQNYSPKVTPHSLLLLLLLQSQMSLR